MEATKREELKKELVKKLIHGDGFGTPFVKVTNDYLITCIMNKRVIKTIISHAAKGMDVRNNLGHLINCCAGHIVDEHIDDVIAAEVFDDEVLK